MTPIIESWNALLPERQTAVEPAYRIVGDLAYALQTLLALLAQQAELARQSGNAELAGTIEQRVRRMSDHVDYHLTRARVAASGPSETAWCPVGACANGVVRTLSNFYAGRNPAIEVALTVRCEDLEEILGNLLDIACKWARARAVLEVSRGASESTIVLTVHDDGPGLPEHAMHSGPPARRAARRIGAWFGAGLSIVRNLTEHYGGTVALERSEQLSGMCARITLPEAP